MGDVDKTVEQHLIATKVKLVLEACASVLVVTIEAVNQAKFVIIKDVKRVAEAKVIVVLTRSVVMAAVNAEKVLS